jgi:hypothetical protein
MAGLLTLGNNINKNTKSNTKSPGLRTQQRISQGFSITLSALSGFPEINELLFDGE